MSQFQNPLDNFSKGPSFADPIEAAASQGSASPTVDNGQEMASESRPMWETTDVLAAVPRGLVGGVKGIYNTADWIAGDVLPDWNTNPLGESRSTAGGLVEGLSEFALALIPGEAAIGVVGGLAKAGRLGATAGKGLGWLARGEKLGQAAKMTRSATSFAAGSFIMATPGQERLSNLALQFDSPLVNNAITQYLASDENETQLEARLKSALESIPLTFAFDAAIDGIMHGIKAVKAGSRAGESALAAGASTEEASAIAAKAEAEYAAQNRKSIEESAQSFSKAKNRNFDEMAATPLADDAVSSASAPDGYQLVANGAEARPLSKSPALSSALKTELDNLSKNVVGEGDVVMTEDRQMLIDIAKEAWKDVDKIGTEQAKINAIGEGRMALEQKYGKQRNWPEEARQLDYELRNTENGILKESGSKWEPKTSADRRAKRDALAAIVAGDKPVSEVLASLKATDKGLHDQVLASAFEDGLRLEIGGVRIGGTVVESLETMRASGTLSESQSKIVDLLLKKNKALLEKSPVRSGEAALDGVARARGSYNWFDRMVVVYNQADNLGGTAAQEVLIHEAVHATTTKKIHEAIRKATGEEGLLEYLATGQGAELATKRSSWIKTNKGLFDDDVRRLFDIYEELAKRRKGVNNPFKQFGWSEFPTKAGEDAGVYGFTNVDEMVAEAFSNREFQQLLASIDLGKNETLWSKFVDVISKMLGLESLSSTIKREVGMEAAGNKSALDAVLTSGAELISRSEMDARNLRGMRLPGGGRSFSKPSMTNDGSVDASLAGRGTPKSGQAPIPNVARPSPIEEMRPAVEEILKRVRSGGTWTTADVSELQTLMENATNQRLQNFGFGQQNGTQTADFMLAFAEMVNQNKELYEGMKRVRSNQATADARDEFLSTMASLGGMNDEQIVRFSKTIADWHGPQFEDGAAIVQALLGAQVNKHLEAFTNGATHGERAAVYETLVSLGALDRKISNIVGRTLQNRKMLWKEELAQKISAMGPAEVAAKHDLLKSYLEIGVIDKETFFRIRDNGFLNAGGIGIATWMFKNSILSGPATSAINALSGVMSHLYMPAERALGELVLTGMGKSSLDNASRELRVYRGYMSSVNDVWNSVKLSWKNEGDSVTLGPGNSPYGENIPRRPVSADNPALARPMTKMGIAPYKFDPTTNKNQLTLSGAALEWFGKAAGLPTRAMGAIDETLSAVYARAEAREVIADAAPAAVRKDPKLLAAFVEQKMKEAFDDVGALYSEEAVRAQIMRQANSQGFAPGSPEWTAFVQNQMAGRWTAPQGIERENMEFLKRVGDKVRRRTEYGTFKRDYDAITEGNTFAPHTVGQLGKAASGLTRHVPAASMILPFIKTPTNLAAWALERNPTSAGMMLKREWNNPEMRGEVMGRLAAGTLFYSTLLGAAMSGYITGRGPSDPNVRKALVDSGWQPNSIKIGDTYVQYSRLDPFATMFGMVADMVEISNHKYTDKEFENATDAVAKVAIGTIANNLVNKTYLAGLKGSLDAIMNWEQKGPQFLRQYAASAVPNFMAQSNLVMNDDMAAPRSALDAIRARIPGLGDTVDRQRNSLGEAMENNSEVWNLALPVKKSTETRDPVKQELAKLLVGFAPPDPQLDGGINLTQYKSASGQSAYDRYQELTGTSAIGGKTLRDRLAQIISTPQYRQMPETSVDGVQTSRVTMLRGEISRYRREALRRLQAEFPDIAERRSSIANIKANMARGM